jgi:hypothetical protein
VSAHTRHASAGVVLHCGAAALGWRNAYLVLRLLAAVVGAGMALMIENDPCERGLGPDGDPLRSGASSVQSAGASIGAAIRSRRFVGLYAGCLICSFGLFVPFVHLVPYAQDHGIPQSSAVLLLASRLGHHSLLPRPAQRLLRPVLLRDADHRISRRYPGAPRLHVRDV